MATNDPPYEPPWPTRVLSNTTVGFIGFLCRSFLYGLSTTEVHGFEHFKDLVDERSDPQWRQRGLITVSNHVSVLDDPVIWGVLPYSYHWDANNARWSLGSHDICFKNGQSLLTAFFTYGNTLPVHRIAHSKYGGLFQPTMTQVIRLLSDPHNQQPYFQGHNSVPAGSPFSPSELTVPSSLPPSDPFSSSALTYTTNGFDSFPTPAAYPSRRYSWVHVFPEGKIHQHPDRIMRYFKWGIARMILESEPCPDVLPMWIDGPQEVMSNLRTFPRPLPRPGKDISIWFGDRVDVEKVFGPFRRRWQEMEDESKRKRLADSHSGQSNEGLMNSSAGWQDELGEVHDESLRYSPEVQQLRIEVTQAVREEVLKVRRLSGLPDEDPKGGLAETWREEGSKSGGEGEMDDRSVVKDL